MAYAIMGGLAVATLLTLVFLPALYVAWFRIKRPVTAVVDVDAGRGTRCVHGGRRTSRPSLVLARWVNGFARKVRRAQVRLIPRYLAEAPTTRDR
jgi:hypothetical protein